MSPVRVSTLLAILVSTLVFLQKTTSATSCATLSDSVEERTQLLRSDLHESFYQMSDLQEAVAEENFKVFTAKKRGPVSVSRALLYTDINSMQCGVNTVTQMSHSNVSDPCPRAWAINSDPQRIPRDLMEVHCLPCENCLSEGSGQDLGVCSNVTYFTRVLRNSHCADGGMTYVPIWEPITVGCACKGSATKPSADLVDAHNEQS